MARIRVIPVLLIQNEGLVKSEKFKKHKYVGDPINAVKIFNDKEVDEIAIIDIQASMDGLSPNFDFIKEIASEAFMPLSYGGGIKSLDHIRQILYNGAEKVILQSALVTNSDLVKEASAQFGSQSIVACVDYKKNWLGKIVPTYQRGSKKINFGLLDWVLHLEDSGIGEIVLQSVDRDGTFLGYDLEVLETISEKTKIPIVALGGCSGIPDMQRAVNAGAQAVGAGSLFVYQMPHRAVLINYPNNEIKDMLDSRQL